ncbi:MAG: hypothetical protein MZV64_11015 [Ignavibacteriales bacterium]|nr:hypothetical protein [Ignavibacteriales bacterium]
MPPLRHRALARLAFAAALALPLSLSLSAQEPAKRLDVRCIVTPPPRIDGLIDDACWQAVAPVSGFYPIRPDQRRQSLGRDFRLGRLRPGPSLLRLPHEGLPAR